MKKYTRIEMVNNEPVNVVDLDGINSRLYEALDSKSEKKLTRTVLELVKGCDGDKEAVAFAASTAVDRHQMSVKEFNKVSKAMNYGMNYNAFMSESAINVKYPGTGWFKL